MIKAFKGRSLDVTRKIRVHRNLHKKTWSITQGGRVVAHAESVVVNDCAFIVNKGGWKRMMKTGKRNVHAFVEGFVEQRKIYDVTYSAYYNRDKGQFQLTRGKAWILSAEFAFFDPCGMKVAGVYAVT